MPGTKPSVDKPTGRVVVLIAVLILAGASLRGYLPARDGAPVEPMGGNRAAMMLIVVALAATIALLAFAIIARLRDPRAVAPGAGDLSRMLGDRGGGRPSWRVVLIALGVVLAWLLVAMLLAHLFAPPAVSPPAQAPDSGAPPSVHGSAPAPKPPPQNDSGDMIEILLVSAVPLLVMLIVGSVILSRRRRRSTPGILADDGVASPPAASPELLVRAAEVGLAEIADLSREPREAIIACYAAMERELANVPGAVPQEFDTPTEVLARAVEHHVLHANNAGQLVELFAEARFSPHVMNEGHREVAVRVLQLVLDELAPRSGRRV
jgi:hypothetical protein